MENFSLSMEKTDPKAIAERIRFLQSAAPFDLLPQAEIKIAAANIREIHYQKDSVLFVQEKTFVTQIVVLRAGRMKLAARENGGDTSEYFLELGSVYGGISLLFNNGISTSTVRCEKGAVVYLLDKKNFLRLCIKYSGFSDYFSRTIDQKIRRHGKSSVKIKTDSEFRDFADFLLWKPVRDIARVFPTCYEKSSIREAARLFTASGRSALVVTDDKGHARGLVTDEDLRKKVIVEGRCADEAVESIMSSPLIQVDGGVPVLEALRAMISQGIKHLGVYQKNLIQLVVTERDLLLEGSDSPLFLIHKIQNLETLDQLRQTYDGLPEVVGRLIADGVTSGRVNGIITAVTDAVLCRVLDMTIKSIGPPPADFAFMVFGSDGRKEQTLKTDQDNAIVYEDLPERDREGAGRYFLEMGTKVCDSLHEIGQEYCEFNIMAKNPEWCQPLSTWKNYYRKWILSYDPDQILNACIFFDARLGYGTRQLLEELHSVLFAELAERQGFLRQMARNALHYRPPLSFFGNFVFKENWDRKGGFDIKSAMRLVVDFVRIYALQESITETNTVKRLQVLHSRSRIGKHDYEDLVYAYDLLMFQRLKHQSEMIRDKGGPPDNFIRPSNLRKIDQQAIKEAFRQIRVAQARVRMDFSLYFP